MLRSVRFFVCMQEGVGLFVPRALAFIMSLIKTSPRHRPNRLPPVRRSICCSAPSNTWGTGILRLPPEIENGDHRITAHPERSRVIQPVTSTGGTSAFCPAYGRNGILSGSAGRTPAGPVSWGQNSPEANVVVGIVRGVVVAIANTAVVRGVVPTAAAIHAVRALWTEPPKDLGFQVKNFRLYLL
jgi:hypothetical protein